jgi:hypothetical protein
MVTLRLLVVAATLLAVAAVGRAEVPAVLPTLTFQDQDGQTLHVDTLRGRVIVIVYGTRDGVDHHTEWGRRLHGEMIGQGVYRGEDPPDRRPVQILAVAQMGGIPPAFRTVIRSFVRGHIPAGFSLYLDWEDRMSALFGAHRSLSTVVVSGRDGTVRLVTTGLPKDETFRAVVEMIRRLA